MPKEDLEALLSPPDFIQDVVEGSEEDLNWQQIPDTSDPSTLDPYQQALISTKIVPEMDGKAIKLPGFVVPLEFNDELLITQFLYVPFFGACIHLPPPPPNQIIFVDYPEGIKQDSLDNAYWVYGIVKTSLSTFEVATSAYSLELHHIEPYVFDAEMFDPPEVDHSTPETGDFDL